MKLRTQKITALMAAAVLGISALGSYFRLVVDELVFTIPAVQLSDALANDL